MKWFWQRDPRPKPAPTRPGGAKGFLPASPGYIIMEYACGHRIRMESNIKAPFICPSVEHNGWGEETT